MFGSRKFSKELALRYPQVANEYAADSGGVSYDAYLKKKGQSIPLGRVGTAE